MSLDPRLPDRPVGSPQGAAEAINDLRRIVSALKSERPSFALGVATLHWPGGAASTSATITHGLGKLPTYALAITDWGGPLSYAQVGSFTTTTIGIGIQTPNGAQPAAQNQLVYWLVA